MSLTEFQCESLEIEARFNSADFDRESFLSDSRGSVDDDAEPVLRWSFGSTENKGAEHAHLTITLPTATEDGGENKGKFRLVYHRSEFDVHDVRPPYMEDCASWLGKFFKGDDLWVDISALFLYEKNYEPTLNLPFPLVTENKALSGATVSGLTIEPPIQSQLRRVMIQRTGEDIIAYASAKNRLNLKMFDLRRELEKISTIVRSLIKEKKE